LVAIEALADCTLHDRTLPADILERTGDADAVLLNKAVLDARTIEKAPNLKYVGILATGWNTIDLAAAKKRDSSFPTCPATAPLPGQHAFALCWN
jgi:glycerate dehydrogenase